MVEFDLQVSSYFSWISHFPPWFQFWLLPVLVSHQDQSSDHQNSLVRRVGVQYPNCKTILWKLGIKILIYQYVCFRYLLLLFMWNHNMNTKKFNFLEHQFYTLKTCKKIYIVSRIKSTNDLVKKKFIHTSMIIIISCP